MFFFAKYSCLKYPIFVIIIKKYGMRKFCLVLIGLFLCIDGVNAAGRTQSQNTRQNQRNTTNTINRSLSTRTPVSQQRTTNTSRSSVKQNKIVTGRSATKTISARQSQQPTRNVRAAATVATKTFGNNYNSCRDAYFTCMDQFCANQNDKYRRCVCSSKLLDIQAREQKLSQTATSLQDFEDININAISKTAAEIKAMGAATDGEQAIKQDKSQSSTTLKNISSILDQTKKQSLSTQGTLDIAGDIKKIWTTTSLIGGSDIAELTGESLFNAVHAQCYEIAQPNCTGSDLKMVSLSYGMYIENDCAVIEANLQNKTDEANATIRTTRHKMQDARLENYDAHNSLTINDCVARVRNDITAPTACGNEYIRCLDFSGKYINATTGEAIYSPEFYQIENQISLSGDVLKNDKNTAFINMLDKKRNFATKTLDLCRDNANEVWDEFLRQAIVEIYQSQQQRVKSVKDECLQVVNECYLKKSDQLKDFATTDTLPNLNQTLELAEEMCESKLRTCSNLYGGGSDGLNTLVATMTNITDTTIEQSCPDLLKTFVQKICAVSPTDSAHAYPYGCRKYAPGESRHARITKCNQTLINPFGKSTNTTQKNTSNPYKSFCSNYPSKYKKIYTSCNYGYYLYCESSSPDIPPYGYCKENATECRKCPTGVAAVCVGGTEAPNSTTQTLYDDCGKYYIGSLYQQLVIYALQNCTRSSDQSGIPSEALLADINTVMQSVQNALAKELSKECSAQDGIWVDIPYTSVQNTDTDDLLWNFYTVTGANTLWGYCKQKSGE